MFIPLHLTFSLQIFLALCLLAKRIDLVLFSFNKRGGPTDNLNINKGGGPKKAGKV